MYIFNEASTVVEFHIAFKKAFSVTKTVLFKLDGYTQKTETRFYLSSQSSTLKGFSISLEILSLIEKNVEDGFQLLSTGKEFMDKIWIAGALRYGKWDPLKLNISCTVKDTIWEKSQPTLGGEKSPSLGIKADGDLVSTKEPKDKYQENKHPN